MLLAHAGSCVHAQQSEPASTSPEQKQGEDDELLTAPDLEVEDLTSRQLDQVCLPPLGHLCMVSMISGRVVCRWWMT